MKTQFQNSIVLANESLPVNIEIPCDIVKEDCNRRVAKNGIHCIVSKTISFEATLCIA